MAMCWVTIMGRSLINDRELCPVIGLDISGSGVLDAKR